MPEGSAQRPVADTMPDSTVIVPFTRGDAAWNRVLRAVDGQGSMPAELEALYGPLLQSARSVPFVIAQLGQSLDGRIATENGDSKYINGEPGLLHLHRLRALCDCVIVGIGTALADDPMLNVRLCAGPNPARVVIDSRGRLPIGAKILREDGARRVIVTATETSVSVSKDVEIIRLPRGADGRIAPSAIVEALGERGFKRLLLEGGSQTISGFLAARALDRLHMLVAPMIVGSGQNGLALPPITQIGDALRPPTRPHIVGDEVIFDCDLSSMQG